MRMFLIFGFLLMALLVASNAKGEETKPDYSSTGWMVESCNQTDGNWRRTMCLGYIDGVADTLAAMEMVCAGDVSRGDLSDIVLGFIAKQRATAGADVDGARFWAFVALALATSLPCAEERAS